MSALSAEQYSQGLACFYLGSDLFALNLRLVSEINRHIDLTPARTAPDFVSGLVNLRGQIVTVVDLSKLIGLGSGRIEDASRLLVLKTNAELQQINASEAVTSPDKIGLLVDGIADVVTPSEEQLEPPPPNLHGVARSFLCGVCKTKDDAIGILDVEQLLTTPESDT